LENQIEIIWRFIIFSVYYFVLIPHREAHDINTGINKKKKKTLIKKRTRMQAPMELFGGIESRVPLPIESGTDARRGTESDPAWLSSPRMNTRS